jgi:ferritin
MPGTPLKPALSAEIQRQFNQEFSASHAYMALAVWCEDRNFKGFASYFHKQAAEERVHAEKMMAHLLDRAVLPELVAVPAPKTQFKSIMEIAKHTQAMEQANTKGIHAVYEAALAAKDYPAQILFQWFISEQVEEEAWTDELVDRVVRAECAGSLAELDRHIEKHLTQTVIGGDK